MKNSVYDMFLSVLVFLLVFLNGNGSSENPGLTL